MDLQQTAGAIVALALVVGAARFLVFGMRVLADAGAPANLLTLLEPQWKREADFLARSIPAGDQWS